MSYGHTYGHTYNTGYKNQKTECHWGNPLVFTTHDGIEVYAGGSSRGGGWWKMEPLPDLAMGPDSEVRKGYSTLEVKTKARNMDGWSCLDHLVTREPPAVLEMDFPDYNVPQDCDVQFWVSIAHDIREKDIKTVHTMCMGGHGRTGIQLACLRWHLATEEERKAWPDAHTLVMDIRNAYCHSAVEADSQQAYVATMCGIPVGQPLPFHKGYGAYKTNSYSTIEVDKDYDAHNRPILECTECDFCAHEDEEDDLTPGDFCWDYNCQGKLVDVTGMLVQRTSTKHLSSSCLCLTTLDVTSELNVMKVGILSRDLMTELHGEEWPKVMQKLFNQHKKTTLRGQLLRTLNKALLDEDDKDREDILVCITDTSCDERMSSFEKPDYSKKEDLKFTSRSFVQCGFCTTKASPSKMAYAWKTNGENTSSKLENICSECVLKLGDMELESRIESHGGIHVCQPVLVKEDSDEENWPKGHLVDEISPNYALRLKIRRDQNKPNVDDPKDVDDFDDLSGKYNNDIDYSDDNILDAMLEEDLREVSWI